MYQEIGARRATQWHVQRGLLTTISPLQLHVLSVPLVITFLWVKVGRARSFGAHRYFIHFKFSLKFEHHRLADCLWSVSQECVFDRVQLITTPTQPLPASLKWRVRMRHMCVFRTRSN